MDLIDMGKIPRVYVHLNDISEFPGPYCMSFDFHLGPLIDSIETVGLLNEPYMVGKKGGKTEVVVGFRRIKALKALKKDKVLCRDLTDTGLSELELLTLNLRDNLATREFNDVEKGMVLGRLRRQVSKDQVLKYYMPLLGLPPREDALETFIALESLEPRIKQALVRGNLSLPAVKTLLELDTATASHLFQWIIDLKLSFNYQLQFIEYVRDISSRERKSMIEVLGSLSEAIRGTKANEPQKVKKIFRHLGSRRYPSLHRAEEDFRKTLAGLTLPKGVRVKHPPYFESHQLSMEISFKNGPDLKKKIDELQLIDEISSINAPW